MSTTEFICETIKAKKEGPRLRLYTCFHSFFLSSIPLLSFDFFFKLSPKNQTTMDGPKHNSCNSCVFLWPYLKFLKKKSSSIIEKQAQQLNKRTEKWKEIKQKNQICEAWFRVYFDSVEWNSSKQHYFIVATLASKVANWPLKLIGILFLLQGQVRTIVM